jgi:tetratricopeptide (TPR) repeat protein
MGDNPRIEELRRRVHADPASIAFAALAEEYRRSGAYQEAIETCRTGLQRHPSYLSARVTLGRALIELGDYATARQELEAVLKVAPENLAAIRAMSDIHQRTHRAPEPAPAAPAEPAHAGISDWKLPPAPPAPPAPQALPAPPAPPAPQALPAPPAPSAPAPVAAAPARIPVSAAPNAVLGRLESLLASIQAARSADRAGR